jgi:anti-sigma factor ChrR (cupin superfamily)
MSDEHREWEELAAAHALHALEPEDELRFSRHLAGCEQCQASVDEHSLIAAQLGALAHTQGESEPMGRAPEWSSIRSSVVGATAAPPVDELASARNRRLERSRRWLTVAAAVAVFAGAGVALWRLNTTSSGTAAASCQGAVGCHVVTLTSVDGRHKLGKVVVRGSTATVDPSDMPAAGRNEKYVLWQVPRDGRPTIVSQFAATGQHSRVGGSITVPYADLLWFAISEEPAGATPTKPSHVLAEGTTA